jgi:hypothetical protein
LRLVLCSFDFSFLFLSTFSINTPSDIYLPKQGVFCIVT